MGRKVMGLKVIPNGRHAAETEDTDVIISPTFPIPFPELSF